MKVSAREVARRALRRVETEGAFATNAVNDELAALDLEARDRRLVTELVHGVLRHTTRLDRALEAAAPRGLKVTKPMRIILRLAAYQHLFLDRIPPHAIVSDAVDAARSIGGQRMAGFANGLLRKLVQSGEPALPPRTSPRAYAEVAGSLPKWLVRELEAGVGRAELAAVADALATVPPLGLRVCLTQTTREALRRSLSESVSGAQLADSPLAPAALLAQGLGSPTECAGFGEGLFTVQDVAAQLIGHLAAPKRGMRILDACAGVGGKATHLVELADDAQVTAVDQSEAKLERLRETATRLGVAARITPVLSEFSAYARSTSESFDLVVLDAPCSGLGVLRRHPEAKWRVTPEDIARLAALQSELLDAAAPRVALGGTLVYSVCSFTRAEGPQQLEAFLARHPGFELESPVGCVALDPALPWAQLATREGAVATWPHRHEADGFFAARLVRRR